MEQPDQAAKTGPVRAEEQKALANAINVKIEDLTRKAAGTADMLKDTVSSIKAWPARPGEAIGIPPWPRGSLPERRRKNREARQADLNVGCQVLVEASANAAPPKAVVRRRIAIPTAVTGTGLVS